MEDIKKIAEIIRKADNWLEVLEEIGELCEAAGLKAEWEHADGDTFEEVIEAAAEKLGVEI